MTILEIIQTVAIWIIIGAWICYKRNWYEHEGLDQWLAIFLTILFLPLTLIIALGREFIGRDWTYHK